MATKLTRQQYNEIYGVSAPAVSTTQSELDTSPTVVPMTSAEYNAKYRPKELSFFSGIAADVQQDIAESRQALRSTVAEGAAQQQRIIERQESDEVSTGTGLFQRFGQGLGTVIQGGFDTVLGLGKMALPETGRISEKSIRDFAAGFAERANEYNTEFIEDLRSSENETERRVAADLDEFAHLYRTNETFRTNVQSAGSIAEGLFMAVGARPATGAITEIRKPAVQLVKEGTKQLKEKADQVFAVSDNAAALKAANEIKSIEEKTKKGRQLIDSSKDGGAASRDRIARSGVLQGAVDEDGLIRTKQEGGAVEQYKKLMIDDSEDVVKRVLIKENKSLNVQEIEDYLKLAIYDSGLEGADLVKGLNSVAREIEGLTKRANVFGNVPLSKVQDFKIRTTQNINYLTDSTPTVRLRKAKAAAYKQIIEDKSDAPIKKVNAELAKYYDDISRLERLDGARVKGGRLGKYFSSIGGQVVGGLAGSAGGAAGAGVGAIVGGEVASRILGRSMAGTFGRATRKNIDKNPTLQKAEALAKSDIDLKSPDLIVALPDGVKHTPETKQLEKNIRKNVKQQRAAIKAGDFDMVASLKEIYRLLVQRLEEYAENNLGVGLSIQATVTPNRVARKMDIEDVDEMRIFLADTQNSLLDEKIQKILSEMGLEKADVDTQARFIQDTLAEVEQLVTSGRHPLIKSGQRIPSRRNLNQSDAPITPNTTQTIDTNVEENN